MYFLNEICTCFHHTRECDFVQDPARLWITGIWGDLGDPSWQKRLKDKNIILSNFSMMIAWIYESMILDVQLDCQVTEHLFGTTNAPDFSGSPCSIRQGETQLPPNHRSEVNHETLVMVKCNVKCNVKWWTNEWTAPQIVTLACWPFLLTGVLEADPCTTEATSNCAQQRPTKKNLRNRIGSGCQLIASKWRKS